MPYPDVSPEESSTAFRMLRREHARLDALDLYARVVERTKGPIGDPGRIDTALATVRKALVDVASSKSTLHGWRVQALFEAVVASLGRVQLLKLEDSGDVFVTGPDLKPPDFRIVTTDGDQMLVEVKNFYHTNETAPFRMRAKDFDELQRYAHLVGVQKLKVAIYWSRWNLWTLVNPSRFEADGPDYRALSLPAALQCNDMGRIGDRIPGTEWPLGLIIYSDPAKPRTVNPNGEAQFTIGKLEYVVAGRVVTAPAEQRIVMRLMLHGGWPEDARLDVVDGKLISNSFLYAPETQPPEGQQFAMHSPLSSIFSSMFNEATMDADGEITALRVRINPSALAKLIPDDYEGETLRIWRIHQVAARAGDENEG
ncbi:MAG TPA: hypothetical protein VNF26_08985 [Candidatus Baltobacterales bacterium]|nr:hypothetical protein [Candidatus Baltobacterales bacterium]